MPCRRTLGCLLIPRLGDFQVPFPSWPGCQSSSTPHSEAASFIYSFAINCGVSGVGETWGAIPRRRGLGSPSGTVGAGGPQRCQERSGLRRRGSRLRAGTGRRPPCTGRSRGRRGAARTSAGLGRRPGRTQPGGRQAKAEGPPPPHPRPAAAPHQPPARRTHEAPQPGVQLQLRGGAGPARGFRPSVGLGAPRVRGPAEAGQQPRGAAH